MVAPFGLGRLYTLIFEPPGSVQEARSRDQQWFSGGALVRPPGRPTAGPVRTAGRRSGKRCRRTPAARLVEGFLDDVKPWLHVVDYGGNIRTEAEEVFRRRGRDHQLSFCDAISFVAVTSLLQHIPCFGFDEDFRRLGLTVIAKPR